MVSASSILCNSETTDYKLQMDFAWNLPAWLVVL